MNQDLIYNQNARAPFEDVGPDNKGATFDFSFGSLDAGKKFTFNMYYGAASNQVQAESALHSIGAELYALAKSSNAARQCVDEPNTFIMAFTGVGGTPRVFPTMAPSANPSFQPSLLPSSPPSVLPSSAPSVIPSSMPSKVPSSEPSSLPSSKPSSEPSSFPSWETSSEPSSFPSSEPSSVPSSNPTYSSCARRDVSYACAFTLDQKYQEVAGYSSVCVKHHDSKSNKEEKYHFHNACMLNSELNELAIGDIIVGKEDNKILMGCGCCDDDMLINIDGDKAKLKNYKASYCSAPICTPNDINWQPCNTGKSSKKDTNHNDNSTSLESLISDDDSKRTTIKVDMVEKINVCVHNVVKNTYEEKCVDPFYVPKSVDEVVVCGSCELLL